MKTILEKEINLIKDKSKRDATRDCIAIRENELRDYPASISGRYHPPEERGPGGLLLHIARMCRVAEDLTQHLALTDEEHDLLIVSCILHDISNIDLSERDGYGRIIRDHKKYSEFHGELSYVIASKYFVNYGFEHDSDFMLQLNGIMSSHMGYWLPNSKKPTRKMELILSILDYIDTREYVHIDLPGVRYV